jgi:RimJ/RimL family protein N-acetyltransferase
VTPIDTKRLHLEPVTAANAGVLWRIMQMRLLREYQDVPRYTRDDFVRRVAARPRRFDGRATGRFEWLVVIRATREPVGWISLRLGEQHRGTAEIGYSIVTGYRSGGYATEAAVALIDYAFEETALRKIDACCVPENLPSRRLLARAGFVEMRTQHNGAIVRGKPVDIVIYELHRERWETMRSGRSGAQASSENSIEIPASAKGK